MKIGIIGASGFVGNVLASTARAQGHDVVEFSRSERPGWRVFSSAGVPDFSGLDAVVNLAGESVLGLWTEGKKRRIVSSRVESTRAVVAGVRAAGTPVLVNASAIGFYGDTGTHAVDETAPSGQGFLAETVRLWEAEARAAESETTRLALVRIGFVLGAGGAMALMRPAFLAGLGGRLGDGKQFMSWVHVRDVAGIILHAATDERVRGPINAVAPEAVTNADFTQSFAASLGRFAILPAPAWGLRLALGEMATLMLDSTRVLPTVAAQTGYAFARPTLTTALRDLGK